MLGHSGAIDRKEASRVEVVVKKESSILLESQSIYGDEEYGSDDVEQCMEVRSKDEEDANSTQ